MSVHQDVSFTGEFDPDFVDGDDDIRQGDLLQLIEGPIHPADEWSGHFAVILTADCDLAFGKHGGILSYVPIVPISVYVRLMLLPRVLDAEVSRSEAGLENSLPTDPGWPSLQRVRGMIALGESDGHIIQLLPEQAETTATVGSAVRRLAEAVRGRDSYPVSSSIEGPLAHVDAVLTELRSIDGNKPLPPGDCVRKELSNRLERLPEDCLFLGLLSASAAEGYVAYLRFVREIHLEMIARSAVGELKLGSRAAARRIGRLRLIYRHRLAQQMAKVFTDIGLPDRYESHRDRAVKQQLSQWVDQLQPTA